MYFYNLSSELIPQCLFDIKFHINDYLMNSNVWWYQVFTAELSLLSSMFHRLELVK